MDTPATVLVTSRSFGSGDVPVRARLESAGARVVTASPDHELSTLRDTLAEAVGWIAGVGPITAEHLAAAPKLRIIARYGVGVDSIDLAAADRHHVLVTNTPGANSGAVADHSVALILSALRNIAGNDRAVRRGSWAVSRTRELSSLVVGIIGLGRIGRGVAARLTGFGGTVVGHDPWVPEELARSAGIEPVSADELVTRSDIISLHAPGDQTLVDREWLRQIRPGLVLVNTARSNLVDEAAIAEALRSGVLGWYAADVLASEGASGASPLLASDLVDRTTFTPHTAAQTVQAVDGMGMAATAAVLAVLRGEIPDHLVTTPSPGARA